jgi:hypothetical protein
LKTIYKYELPYLDQVVILMPKGAKPLCAQIQSDELFLWAMVDREQPLERRVFRVVGTGEPIPDADSLVYLDTIQIEDGRIRNLVFHVFEVKSDDSP